MPRQCRRRLSDPSTVRVERARHRARICGRCSSARTDATLSVHPGSAHHWWSRHRRSRASAMPRGFAMQVQLSDDSADLRQAPGDRQRDRRQRVERRRALQRVQLDRSRRRWCRSSTCEVDRDQGRRLMHVDHRPDLLDAVDPIMGSSLRQPVQQVRPHLPGAMRRPTQQFRADAARHPQADGAQQPRAHMMPLGTLVEDHARRRPVADQRCTTCIRLGAAASATAGHRRISSGQSIDADGRDRGARRCRRAPASSGPRLSLSGEGQSGNTDRAGRSALPCCSSILVLAATV